MEAADLPVNEIMVRVSHVIHVPCVASVTIRELRNHGREVVDRVLGGESLVVTRSGTPVAELRPIGPPTLDAATLLARWNALPAVDPVRWLSDIDRYMDASF